jgi:hypothetical protein
MPVQSDPLVQWQFVEVSAAPKSRWYWRKFLASSALETVSEEFSDYGLAVSDALRHGFKPKRHHWSVVTPNATTHYLPSGDPVAVPNAAEPGSLSPPAARTVERRLTARSESVGKA